jgi:carbon storage regulator
VVRCSLGVAPCGQRFVHRLRAQGGAVLVLTRKASQSIVIGENIVITILDVHRDQVRIGIEAPRDIDVHRQEIFDALQRANREAAQSAEEVIRSDG